MRAIPNADDTRSAIMLRGAGLEHMSATTPLDAVRLYMVCVLVAVITTAFFVALISDRRHPAVPVLLIGLLWCAVYWV